MARFTGGGSVRASRASQISNRDRVFPSARQSRLSSLDNKSSTLRQDRVLLRSVSSPKLTDLPGKKKKPPPVSRSNTARSEVPRLELSVAQSEYRQEGRRGRGGRGGRLRQSRREEELSAEFLPVHNTASLRPVLSDQTQSELVLSVPSVEDETLLATAEEDDTFDMNRTTDFVKANMKAVGSGVGGRTGRSSAVSNAGSVGSVVPHKAGSVPRYLRDRQAQWAEEAAAALAAIPDPDCPPGHVRLPEEQRLQMVESFSSQHAGLLQDLNRLPVSSDSRRVVNRRKQLETNLTQLEEDIKKFSRPKVFMPVDRQPNNDIL